MPRKEERVHVEIEMPTYSDTELIQFGKKLDTFRRRKTLVSMGKEITIDPVDLDEAMVAFGAKVQRDDGSYAVVLHVSDTDSYGNIKRYQRPTKIELFEHKYEAYKKYAGRQNQEVDREEKALEKMSRHIANEKRV